MEGISPQAVGAIIGAIVVTILGSGALAKFFAARGHAASGSAPSAPRLPELEKVREDMNALSSRVTRLEAEALTIEEFNAYVTMDSERREKLIVRIAEIRGQLAAMLPGMRD